MEEIDLINKMKQYIDGDNYRSAIYFFTMLNKIKIPNNLKLYPVIINIEFFCPYIEWKKSNIKIWFRNTTLDVSINHRTVKSFDINVLGIQKCLDFISEYIF